MDLRAVGFAVWIGFIALEMQTGGGLLWAPKGTLDMHKRRDISWLAENIALRFLSFFAEKFETVEICLCECQPGPCSLQLFSEELKLHDVLRFYCLCYSVLVFITAYEMVLDFQGKQNGICQVEGNGVIQNTSGFDTVLLEGMSLAYGRHLCVCVCVSGRLLTEWSRLFHTPRPFLRTRLVMNPWIAQPFSYINRTPSYTMTAVRCGIETR
jgi:hypothetical protein